MATITVLGRAQLDVPPDEATLGLTVEVVHESAEEALAVVAERARALVALLDELGVAPERRATAGIVVREEREHDREGRSHSRGYRAAERLTVATGDAGLVGRLVGLAVERAGAAVDGPAWSVRLDNPARRAALAAAAEDGRARAEALAEGLGGTLGALVDAVETGSSRPEPRGGMRVLAADLPVEPGTATVTAAVSLTYEVTVG